MTWVPESCTLPTAEQPLRVEEFDQLFARATRTAQRLGATRLRIDLSGGQETYETARELVARETTCCSFFAFDLQPAVAGTVLEVQVPESHVEVVDAMQQRIDAARARRAS